MLWWLHGDYILDGNPPPRVSPGAVAIVLKLDEVVPLSLRDTGWGGSAA